MEEKSTDSTRARKRARKDEEVEDEEMEDEEVEDEDEDAAAKAHHPSLFFEDGNVILATKIWLFRVHKSILKLHCDVFEDMFSLPQPSSPQLETYLDLPLVHMPDDDEDMVIFLRTIYERGFYNPLANTHISTILVLLRLSTKYSAEGIKGDVVYQLSSSYPVTLESFDQLNGSTWPVYTPPYINGTDGGAIPPEDMFMLLKLAIETRTDTVLPLLFYSCASYDIDSILKAIGLLSRADAVTLLAGRGKLIAKFDELVIRRITSINTDVCCQKNIFSRFAVTPGSVDIPYGLVRYNMLEWWRGKLCKGCSRTILPTFTAARKKYWDAIPQAFGFVGYSAPS